MSKAGPPPVWKLTPLGRSLVDFDVMLRSPEHGPFFRSLETIEGLHGQLTRLHRRVNALYLLTFFGALLVLSGPLPQGTKIAAFGVEAPLAMLPQQVIALLTAGLFGYYSSQFLSVVILTQMSRKILQAGGRESWQFFAARFDATGLWSVLITPKLVGYRSPKRDIGFALLIIVMTFAISFTHAVIVVLAMVLAFIAALQTGSVLLMIFGGLSVAIASVSLLAVLVSVMLPMPYRLERPAAAAES